MSDWLVFKKDWPQKVESHNRNNDGPFGSDAEGATSRAAGEGLGRGLEVIG